MKSLFNVLLMNKSVSFVINVNEMLVFVNPLFSIVFKASSKVS